MKDKDKEIKPSREGFISNYPHFRYWKKHAVADMLAEEPINIYIHVPFCMQKCAYCYYMTEILKNRGELDGYVDSLCREIAAASGRFHFKKRPVNTIYIGGGTPSLLTEDMLKRITASLHEHFAMENPEFTMEAEPRTINAKKVKTYQELGVTRISIGVQSFCDEIIKLSGRDHTGDKALKAIDTIRDAGNDGIVVNIDLLSGLAGETNDTWAGTLDTAINTNVHSITVYKMEVYLNTDFFKKSVRKKEVQLPSESQELEFMKRAIEKFASCNYKPWSFFTFTRNGGFPHHYAVNIWRGEDCCALGPSGFGILGNYNYQNTGGMDTYHKLTGEGKISAVRGYKLTAKGVMVRDILLGMKLSRFDRKHFEQRHGFDFCNVIPQAVEELRGEGYILLEEDAIILSPKGLLYGDYAGKKLALAMKKYLGLDDLSLF